MFKKNPIPLNLRWRDRRIRSLRRKYGSTPEMEAIVSKLTRKAKRDIDREFNRWLRRYRLRPEPQTAIGRFFRRITGNKPPLPMGEQEAEAMLLNMLKLASARRDLINERLVKSVESGTLYDRYYFGLEQLNDLAVCRKQSDMDLTAARNDHEFAEKTYKDVRELTIQVTDASFWGKLRKKRHAKKGGNPV